MPAPPSGDEDAREFGRERPPPQGTWPSVGLPGTSLCRASVLTRDLFPLAALRVRRPGATALEPGIQGWQGRHTGPPVHRPAECSAVADRRSRAPRWRTEPDRRAWASLDSLACPFRGRRERGTSARQALPRPRAGVLRLARHLPMPRVSRDRRPIPPAGSRAFGLDCRARVIPERIAPPRDWGLPYGKIFPQPFRATQSCSATIHQKRILASC
jgi:hypothetical protein